MPAKIYREQETLEKLAKTAVVRRTARAGSTSRAFEARLLASRLSNEAVPDSAGSLLAMLPPELANQVLRHLGVAAPESVASASNAEAGEPQTSTLDVTTEASVGTSVGTNPDSDENAAGD